MASIARDFPRSTAGELRNAVSSKGRRKIKAAMKWRRCNAMRGKGRVRGWRWRRYRQNEGHPWRRRLVGCLAPSTVPPRPTVPVSPAICEIYSPLPVLSFTVWDNLNCLVQNDYVNYPVGSWLYFGVVGSSIMVECTLSR